MENTPLTPKKDLQPVEIINKAWAILKPDIFKHVLVFTVVFILNAIIAQLGKNSTLLSLISAVLQIMLSMYLLGYSLSVVRRENLSFEGIFTKYVNGKTIIQYLLYAVLIVIATFGITPIFLFFKSSYFFVATLILVLLLLYFAIRLMLVGYYIVDGYDFLDAMQKSWQATKGQELHLFVFILLAIAILIVGILVLFVGILVAYPLVIFAQTLIYLELKGESEEDSVLDWKLDEDEGTTEEN